MFFSIFNIIKTENEVRAKYKTKNIKTDCKEVFLPTINQASANRSSRRNFTLTVTRLYNVWLSGSFAWPFKKMINVMNAIIEKPADKMAMSARRRFNLTIEIRKYAVTKSSTFNNTSNKMYL